MIDSYSFTIFISGDDIDCQPTGIKYARGKTAASPLPNTCVLATGCSVRRDAPAPGENYTILHRSLCDTHIENIRDSYLDVTIYRIGQCPACDGTAAEGQR